MPMIESLWLQLGPFMGFAARGFDHDFERLDQHKEMLAALRERDEERLAAAIIADIREGAAPLEFADFEELRAVS